MTAQELLKELDLRWREHDSKMESRVQRLNANNARFLRVLWVQVGINLFAAILFFWAK